jgi:hypothetical protein
MSQTNDLIRSRARTTPPSGGEPTGALETFWERATIKKLEARFAVAREMDVLPRLPVQSLRAITLQYRYFTQSFATDLADLVARCPQGSLRSLLGRLVSEELGDGDPSRSHLALYDRFLESIGAIERGESAQRLGERVHPKVQDLLAGLHERTLHRSPFYGIGMRGMGGECICGVYFSVMHVHLRQHPFVLEHQERIDWTFWDIHAGHADVEHHELVRAAVAELLRERGEADAVDQVQAGFDYGTSVWEAFWSTLYRDYGQPAS